MLHGLPNVCQISTNFNKFQIENLVDFEQKNAAQRVFTCIYYLLAKIGADTAENEQHFAENQNLPKLATTLRVLALADLDLRPRLGLHRPDGTPAVAFFFRGRSTGRPHGMRLL